MKLNKFFLTVLGMLLISYPASCIGSDSKTRDPDQPASGTLVSGYRVLPIQKSQIIKTRTS